MLSISEFSKLADTSRKLLIYYDNNGIFHPEFVDENGYRYYSFEQLGHFFRICVFKELDMPLKEISTYLNEYSPEREIEILKQQDDILAKKIRALNSSRDMLHSRLKRIKEGIGSNLLEINRYSKDESYLYISKALNVTDKKNKLISSIEHVCLKNCLLVT